ncbi:glycosyltransferase family 2 protein [Alkalinema pantanalense CENA528]|uniref:glycosyltransferase family 2 protein n=1 Tax=Alkalinema pantanalense TaxID=1620705 RepID=UPI003D6FEB6F
MLTDSPFISIIIPVHGRSTAGHPLHWCLYWIAAQTYPHYEVIVVNDGGSSELAGICAQYGFCRYYEQPWSGSYAARNLGASVARGDLLVFTDSDCQPVVIWLAEIVKAMRSSQRSGTYDFIAGHIQFFYQAETPTLIELADSIVHLQQEQYVSLGYGATANLAIPRAAFARVGTFANVLSLGDKDWGQRATHLGYKIGFAPTAIVRHPARSTASALFKKLALQARHQPFCWQEIGAIAGLMPIENYRAVWQDTRCPGLLRKLRFIGLLHGLRWFTVIVRLYHEILRRCPRWFRATATRPGRPAAAVQR